MADAETVDIVIVGSGMGGATLAAGLASSGARIVILERGQVLPDSTDARDARTIFQRGVYRPQETWIDGAGRSSTSGCIRFPCRSGSTSPRGSSARRRPGTHSPTRAAAKWTPRPVG